MQRHLSLSVLRDQCPAISLYYLELILFFVITSKYFEFSSDLSFGDGIAMGQITSTLHANSSRLSDIHT